MSAASTWGEPEPATNEVYPLVSLKYLLKQTMMQFGAQGACIALHDESIGQMRIQAHVRWRNLKISEPSTSSKPGVISPKLSMTTQPGKTSLSSFASTSTSARLRAVRPSIEELEDVTPQQCELFTVGTTYAIGQDLIGYVWHKNEAYTIRYDDYLTIFFTGRPHPTQMEFTPTSFLVMPILTVAPLRDIDGRNHHPHTLGVILLYRIFSDKSGFQEKHRLEASQYVERIALHLQNDQLQRAQRRTSEYLQLLQEISTVFPTSVNLSQLVEKVYEFIPRVVDVSSRLFTVYDRDTDRLYDVFAVHNGVRVEGLDEQPAVFQKDDRPQWWTLTQKERSTLLFSPAQDSNASEYEELLSGTWGEQYQARSFLLLPLKMFNRVIGSISLTSMRPNAYHQEEIQVLETMAQIVTVNIENARLYERDRQLIQEGRQREAQLAAVNSALQAISSELDVNALLNNLVEEVAKILKVDICVFFQPSSDNTELVANALYAPTSVRMVDDGSGMPELDSPGGDDLISMIRLPFKGTFLEHMTNEGFFYLDSPKLEELTQKSPEASVIFLSETQIKNMLMIPMSYPTEFLGFLAVPLPGENRFFRPKDVATLLAICAQATSAVRNAQLFAQREEAYAELQRMDKLKDEFMVTASHELRTPLSAISGYSTLLKRQGARATPQQIMRFATKIATASQQLSYLVANMTEAAKVGSIDKDLKIEAVQLYSAVEVAASILALDVQQEITLDIDPHLWFEGDGHRVRQVLTNLLENAAKYSPPEGQIQVSACAMKLSQTEQLLSEDQIDHGLLFEQGDRPIILVRVTDQGEGIAPQDQQRIFEKFVRAPRSLTTPVRGSGLGLYICRRFIEAMDGKIWLERSVANEGSTFSFYLPRVDPPVDPPDA